MAYGYKGSYQGSYQDSIKDKYSTAGASGYNVDLVFCIDATASMEEFDGGQDRIINMVKRNCLNFHSDFCRRVEEKGKKVNQLRIRIIAFRDYLADGGHAMLETDFLRLPQQMAEFEACIQSIRADGGGDVPEDGLEALAYAINSKWVKTPGKKRHVIVLWTDAGTHPLGYGKQSPHYPLNMAKDLGELGEWWDEMDFFAKRLVLFAPNEEGWTYVKNHWDNVLHTASVAGNGLAETSYEEILNSVVNSV